jgi:hypothetical protein
MCITILLLMAMISQVYALQTEVFRDTFEGYTAGTNVHALVPPVGIRWYEYGPTAPARDIVSETYARQGVRSIYVRRDKNAPFNYPVLAGEGLLGAANEVMPNGDPFYFTFCWYQDVANYDRPSVTADFGTYTGIAGVRVETDNTYQVWDQSLNGGTGGYILTGVVVATDAWEKIQMVLYPGADIGGGNVQFVYDVYLIRENGSRIQLADNAMSGVRQLKMSGGQYAGNNAVITFYCEPPTGTTAVKPYIDDVYIVKNYVPGCGSSEAVAPVGDLSGDCLVDIADVLILAAHWLE